MRSTLLLFAISTVLVAPAAWAKTEVELLREKVSSQQQELAKLKGKPAAPKATASGAAKTPAASSGKYVVAAGDSLEKIARKSGTSSASLAKANGLKPGAIIHPGQALKVPGKSAAAPVVAKVQPTPAPKPAAPAAAVAKISKKPTTPEMAAAKNPTPSRSASLTESKPALISAPSSKPAATRKSTASADTLREKSAATEPEATQERSPTAADPMVTASTSSPKSAKTIQPVTIDSEITYGDFAAKHGTDATRLNALNGLDLSTATVLAKGSELYVPAQP